MKVRLSLSPGSLYFQSLNVLLESVDEMEADCNIDEVLLVKVSLSLSPGSLYFSLRVCYWSLCMKWRKTVTLTRGFL